MEPEALVLLSLLTVELVFWLIDEDRIGKYVYGRQGDCGDDKEVDRLLGVKKARLRTISH